MRVTQLRIFALLLTTIAVILTSVAIGTNKWYTLSESSAGSDVLIARSYGIFYECSKGECKSISSDEGWRGAVIACLMAALSALLIVLIGFIVVIMTNRNAKPLAVVLLTAAVLSCAALIIYPTEMKVSTYGEIGVSYYMGCAGCVVSAGAGIFVLATKEERIVPFVETFSRFSFDSSNEEAS